jgi:FkbM family methyltransferase
MVLANQTRPLARLIWHSRANLMSSVLKIYPTMKRFLPRSAQALIRTWRTHQTQRRYAPLTLAETFDRVYNTGAWGEGDAMTPSSGTGSTGRYVAEYGALIAALLRLHNVRTIADLGCGNFNTGKVLADMAERYIGVDIAQPVIDANTRVHSSESVHFVRADLTSDALPPADAAILRQVLQHLTNAEVEAALSNVLRTYSLAIVTEHVYTGPGAQPNRDMAHGPGTRVPLRSGVHIDQAPFLIRALPLGDIDYAPNEVLRTWVVQNTLLQDTLVQSKVVQATGVQTKDGENQRGPNMLSAPQIESAGDPFAHNWQAYYLTRILQKLEVTGLTLGIGGKARCMIPNPPGILKSFATPEGRKVFEDDASLKAVRKLVRSATSFWDVGANCGIFSLFGREENPNLFVVSIEASTLHYQALQPSVRWVCLHTAVGERDGVTHLSRQRSGFDHIVEAPQAHAGTEVEMRPMAKLDTLAMLLGAESIDVLKIDVEGYELNVLRGATALLEQRRIGAIVLESDGHDLRYGSSEAETIRFLEERGYQVDPALSRVGESAGNCLVFQTALGDGAGNPGQP